MPSHPSPQSVARHVDASRHQGVKRGPRRQEPLDDEQYVATSLALVARLRLRVRAGVLNDKQSR